MSVDTKALREKRAKMVHEAREWMNKHKTEGRNVEQCEINRYNTIMEDVDRLSEEIERHERLENAQRSLSASTG
jgi:hypothetical protein